MSEAQREHLRKRIEAAVTGVPYIRLLENRKHKRITLNLESEAHCLDDNQRFKCQIVDISETGSQIRAEKRPIIGTMMRIGTLRGKVRRHTNEGFAIEFCKEENAPEQKSENVEMRATA